MGLFGGETEDRDISDAVVDDEPAPAVRAGAPGRCPECGGFGYIDHIDMKYRTQTQHCRDCRHSWQFNFDEDGDVIDLTDGAVNGPSGSRAR